MIDIEITNKYIASIFLNASDIKANPEIIKKLMDVFLDKGFIPNTFHEINSLSSAPQVRPRLSSPDSEWSIHFASHRIDIEKNPTQPKGSNIGSLDIFCSDVSDYFDRILKNFKKRANRLSLVTNVILSEMKESDLVKTYTKLFNPIEFYQQNNPFEWNWRSVSRVNIDIDTFKEELNIVTTINRLQGEIRTKTELLPLDRIQLTFDFNTLGENEELRFDINHILLFFKTVQEFHTNLSNQIMRLINE